ncbi:MAG: hypothetical protein U0V87_17815 [Acidobacteriota bacterium]
MRTTAALATLLFLTATVTLAPASTPVAPVTERLVAAQRTIEEVEWQHRLWPSENARAKPSLSEVLSDRQMRGKVDDTLRQLSLLQARWGYTLTPALLQAELDRMARDTRDPAQLAALWQNLHNDADLIGASLVMPRLIEPLIRRYYARDRELHNDVRTRAERERLALINHVDPKSLGVVTLSIDYLFSGGPKTTTQSGQVVLDAQGWNALVSRLSAMWPGNGDSPSPASLPLHQWSPLREASNSFYSVSLTDKGDGRLRVVSASWPKRSFDTWWSNMRDQFSPYALTLERGLRLPVIATNSNDSASPAPSGPTTGACDDDHWTEMRSSLPISRQYHTAVWTGSEMIVWGGQELDYLDSGERYTPATDSWAPVSKLGAPSARYLHVAVWTGSEMIVWGGSDATTAFSTGARYNPSTNQWQSTSLANAPAAASYATAVWTGSEMIVWGGVDFAGSSLGSGGRYAPSTDSWSLTNSAGAPSPRSRHTAVWTGSRMIVWGGIGGGTTGAQYDPSSDSWFQTSLVNAPPARAYHTAVWTGTEMLIYGGDAGRPYGRYNPVTDSWRRFSGGPLLQKHVAVWSGREMLVFGSNNASSASVGAAYDPGAGEWRTLNPNLQPEAGVAHTAVWTGSEMIVWGGSILFNQTANPNDDGGRYNPTTDTWRLLRYTSAPDDRRGHTSVWTGNELLVWGGSFDNGWWYDGGEYIPSTDTWASITDFGAPEPRNDAPAVWTGLEMIVWGGDAVSTVLSSGGRYDPITGTWSSTGYSPGVPLARRGHTTVWTGLEMIVWGGEDVSLSAIGGGSRYDPNTDLWQEVSATDAPGARRQHSAVWTGSRMIVWGGSDTGCNCLLDSGALYDPVADSWLTVNPNNAPLARQHHDAIWTGSRMIVWGGGVPGGGRYDPVTNSWGLMSSVNAPTTPDGAAVVWAKTPGVMLVWGGGPSSPMPRDLAIYDPQNDSWSIGTSVGAPSGRRSFAAAWDDGGSSLLIWGGSGPFNAGSHTGSIFYLAPTAAALQQNTPRITMDKPSSTTVRVSWPAVPAATAYDVLAGNVSTLLSSGGDFSVSTTVCLADNQGATYFIDSSASPSGSGQWYLARAINCAGNSTYDTLGGSQVGLRDAEIAVSAGACP